jgi:hypothetical protein
MQLHIGYLRSLEDSPRARAACVQYLQNFLGYFYPERPDIVREAGALAEDLGDSWGPRSCPGSTRGSRRCLAVVQARVFRYRPESSGGRCKGCWTKRSFISKTPELRAVRGQHDRPCFQGPCSVKAN